MPCDPMPLGWADTADDRRGQTAPGGPLQCAAQNRLGLQPAVYTHIWSILIEMARSELFHSYGMFQPTAPNFLRSMITAW